MPLTLYLAKLLGSIMLVLALWMAARKPQVLAIMRGLAADPVSIFWIGVLRVSMGLALMIGHDVWSGGLLPILITLIGWTTFLRGALMLFAAEKVPAIYEAMGFEKHYGAYVGGSFLLGLYLSIAGYLG